MSRAFQRISASLFSSKAREHHRLKELNLAPQGTLFPIDRGRLKHLGYYNAGIGTDAARAR